MVRANVLADALSTLSHAQKSGKRQVILRPVNAVTIKILEIMQKQSYIGDFTVIDDRRGNKVVVNLIGRLNKAAVISPRFDIDVDSIQNWVSNLLPSRLFGHILISTNHGIMDHNEAQHHHLGGKIIGFFY